MKHQPQLPAIAPPISKSDAPTSDDRCTPPNVLACVDDLWPQGIGLDPCDNPWSIVRAETKWNRTDDSLARAWTEGAGRRRTIWLNPPYSDPQPFMFRARVAADCCEVLALVKHDTTTKWWRYNVRDDAAALCLVGERLHFRLAGEDTGASDHASTIVLYLPTLARGERVRRIAAFERAFDSLGMVVARVRGGR